MTASGGPQGREDAPGLSALGARLAVGALIVIVLLLGFGRWLEGDRLARESYALMSGTIRLSEIDQPIEILRDGRGIPHIAARKADEAFFALGFAHAQDRLAQMVWLRRRAQGRVAEIEGEAALVADQLARVLEIARASEAAVEALPASSKKVLTAYSAGVNARLTRVRGGLAASPRMLKEPIDTVEPWQPADSIALTKLLSWCMGGNLETTLMLDDLIQRLDSVPARPFFPGSAAVDFGVAPVLPPSATGVDRRKAFEPASEVVQGPTRQLCAGIGIPSGGAWVLGGSISESGAPIVVADWHLEPTLPSLFYEAQLSSPSFDVAGATLPGVPLVWAGRNRSVAWAGVPASAPVADLFIETLREERGQYRNGTLWVPIEEREEVVRVRGVRGPFVEHVMQIRSTRHGPLIESLSGKLGSENPESQATMALSWTGAREGDGFSSLLALFTARSAAEILEALRPHHEPVLAVAFADQAGEAGVQVAGWLPKRPLPTGLVPVQGRLRSFDWRVRVPQSELPGERLSATEGPKWLIAADQPWPEKGGLDQMEWLWRPGDRAARLDLEIERRAREARFDLRSAAELFEDEVAERAPRVVTAIVELARRAGPLPLEAAEMATMLERWDGSMSSGSAGAAAYHLVIEHLIDHLLRGPFGDALLARYLAAPHVHAQSAIERLVLRAASLRRKGGWTDEARVGRAARESLRGAWVSLNHRLGPTRDRWAWGGLHRIRFEPLTQPSVVSERIRAGLPFHGNAQTVAFARHRAGISFDVERASLYRVAMDLAASDRMLSSLAPGQSEHPGHAYFADGLARWPDSRLSLLATKRLVVEEESSERLLLEPAP